MLVFISHNSHDKFVAREMSLFLAAENVDVWFDEWKIHLGDSITGKINEGLNDQTHLILLWSKYANGSKWVKREIFSSVPGYVSGKFSILPILLDDTPLPPIIADTKYHIYENGNENDRRVIVNAILGRDPSDDYTRAIVKKYHELTEDPNPKNPLGYNVCPNCGSSQWKMGSYVDNVHQRLYCVGSCLECGWSTNSEM